MDRIRPITQHDTVQEIKRRVKDVMQLRPKEKLETERFAIIDYYYSIEIFDKLKRQSFNRRGKIINHYTRKELIELYNLIVEAVQDDYRKEVIERARLYNENLEHLLNNKEDLEKFLRSLSIRIILESR